MNIDYICKDCNSTEGVFFDAYATWDPRIQEIVHECTLDHCECSCGSTKIEEIEYINVEKKSILDKIDDLINLLKMKVKEDYDENHHSDVYHGVDNIQKENTVRMSDINKEIASNWENKERKIEKLKKGETTS